MIYVFDASFAAALVIPDEQSPRIDALFASIKNEDAIFVPPLFWYEMAGVFKKLVRGKRYSFHQVLAFIPCLEALSLQTDMASGAVQTETLLRIANKYGISARDAAYLELAGRKKARFCSADGRLRAAAEDYGVSVFL